MRGSIPDRGPYCICIVGPHWPEQKAGPVAGALLCFTSTPLLLNSHFANRKWATKLWNKKEASSDYELAASEPTGAEEIAQSVQIWFTQGVQDFASFAGL